MKKLQIVYSYESHYDVITKKIYIKGKNESKVDFSKTPFLYFPLSKD